MAMVNSTVSWRHVRTAGDHVILKWEPPEQHKDGEAKTVSIPLHDELSPGTLKSIAKDAGANDPQDFYEWIESNL